MYFWLKNIIHDVEVVYNIFIKYHVYEDMSNEEIPIYALIYYIEIKSLN